MDRWQAVRDAAGAGEPVARIMYASQALISQSVYAEMERIRASALKHNDPVGVATALLYQSGWFVQWKEGPAPAVLQIMERVATDNRHYDLRVVHRSRGPRLLSGPWSMAIVQCNETHADMEDRIQQLKRQVDAGRQYSPPTIWRRLSTPMEHPGATRHGNADAFQRVLVCSATGTCGFDVVDWLGARHQAEVVHRRFAGAQALDVGTNYVDFVQDGRVWRVVAMARHGLSVPLTRAFLPDYSHMVLLLSIDDDCNLQLMERVLDAIVPLPHPPVLLGVGSRPEMHHVSTGLAKRFGFTYHPVVADSREVAASWTAMQPLLGQWQPSSLTSGLSGLSSLSGFSGFSNSAPVSEGDSVPQ